MKFNRASQSSRLVSGAAVFVFLLFAILMDASPAKAIPAFARKYGLPCSACHITWPELNNFGQVFRDNGYQMMNELDSPITRDASYFPMAIRITPQWHRESANNQTLDPTSTTGTATTGSLTTAGFDLSGMDVWFAGTLFKNISFSALPSSDQNATFHFENAFVRFDNLAGSPWLNVKVGKFELDLPVSEKRLWTLSEDGGFYYIYHFLPAGDVNPFGGIGDNQIGVELMGHNANSYTRYAFSVVSSLDGQPGLLYGNPDGSPAGRTYDYYGHFEQGFNTPAGGFLKLGAYAYFGEAPTNYQSSLGTPIYGIDNEPFYRAGAEVKWYFNKFIFKGVYLHAYDNAYLANGIASNSGSLAGTGYQAAIWNGGFAEFQYVVSPQWDIMVRYEGIRMSQQGFISTNGNQSNMDAFTIASRFNPFMFSRAGLAIQQEYSVVRSNGVTSQGGVLTPSACPVTSTTCNVISQSLFFGFDFDF
ncbi:MAG TPA: hypothetical protein VMJ93_17865 [Verrucomicrobiae bacterium]|nr:hypothetical protein [Verrucomicrobiae bacterium]